MRRFIGWLLIVLVLVSGSARAQGDGLNLTTALYILLNEGRVERYGLGAAGVQAITPETDYVLDFAVAPDDRVLAYRTEGGLTLLDMAGGDSRALDGPAADLPPLRIGGQTMAWSPQGDMLVYTTTYGLRAINPASGRAFDVNINPLLHLSWSPTGDYLAAESEGDIWWIYRRQGDSLALAAVVPSSRGLGWVDGERLIFAPVEGGLLLMDLAAANQQTSLRPAPQRYLLPAVRADGTLAVLTQPADDPQLADDEAYLQLLLLDGESASVSFTATEPINTTGIRWGPGGDLLVAFHDRELALVVPETGQRFPLPAGDLVAYSWGAPRPPASAGFTGETGAVFRAPDFFGVEQVWRLPADGQPPQPLTDVEDDVTAYAIAPGGDALAFISEGTLWTLALADAEAEPEALAEIGADAGAPDFSPDGAVIAYHTAAGIYALRITVGEPALILPAEGRDYSQPQFAPNINALLVRYDDGSGSGYVVLDPTTTEIIELGNYDGARWLPDGRVLAFTVDEVAALDPMQTPPAVETLLLPDSGQVIAARPVGVERVSVLLAGYDPLLPSLVQLVDVPLLATFGAPMPQPTTYLNAPVLSPDGLVIAGMPSSVGGTAVFYDVVSGETQTLRAPTGVKDFRWLTFR